MSLYRCPCGKEEKEISNAIIGLREGKWVCINAVCSCGQYMDSEPEEGFPQLKRTEASLSKDRRHDKLWDEAKEKLTGDRGVNESFD